jgi:hypothetical protein
VLLMREWTAPGDNALSHTESTEQSFPLTILIFIFFYATSGTEAMSADEIIFRVQTAVLPIPLFLKLTA